MLLRLPPWAAAAVPPRFWFSFFALVQRFIFLVRLYTSLSSIQVVSGRSGLSIPSLPCGDPGVVGGCSKCFLLQTTRESVDKPLHPALTMVPAHGFLPDAQKLCFGIAVW